MVEGKNHVAASFLPFHPSITLGVSMRHLLCPFIPRLKGGRRSLSQFSSLSTAHKAVSAGAEGRGVLELGLGLCSKPEKSGKSQGVELLRMVDVSGKETANPWNPQQGLEADSQLNGLRQWSYIVLCGREHQPFWTFLRRGQKGRMPH